MPEIPYLADASTQTGIWRGTDLPTIARAIREVGYWEEVVEWRISTTTAFRIEREVDPSGRRWFKVSATCDHEMTCRCPTLERAMEMMSVYDRLIMDMFWTLGWASWAARRRLEPGPFEVLPPG
ncbi:MAG: hypothetical protein U0Q22_17535 [Acidimicrobiales bacterium]